MSKQKMREALIYIEGLASADDFRDLSTIADVARQALAQPTEAVELTDSELAEAVGCKRIGVFALNMCRSAIAAHEAKKNGGGA